MRILVYTGKGGVGKTSVAAATAARCAALGYRTVVLSTDLAHSLADELTVLPGMDELANLLWINRHRESGGFDTIVVDAAPTDETMRLLSFPDVMRWWMQRIFPIQRRAMGLAQPLISRFVDIPLPTEQVYDSVERLFAQLDKLHGMLIDPRMTTIRLVLNPEKMVISEAERTSTYFH